MCGISLLLTLDKETLVVNGNQFTVKGEQQSAPETNDALVRQDASLNARLDNGAMIHCIESALARRGPDATMHISMPVCASTHACFIGSLLALRGDSPTKQPLVLNDTHYLLWNGEIFGGESYELISKNNLNDSAVLLAQLAQCYDELEALKVIGRIRGPFAFVYYNREKQFLLFGKDQLGKRSFLYNFTSSHLILSSVACPLGGSWLPIGVNGIYCMKFQLEKQIQITHYPWTFICKDLNVKPVLFHREQVEPLLEEELHLPDTVVHNFLSNLSLAVKKRVTRIYDPNPQKKTRVSVLFSGGIDSVVVTALAHLNLDAGEEIDLLNVSFGPGESIDRKQSIIAHQELCTRYPKRVFRLVYINVDKEELIKHTVEIEKLMYPCNTMLDFSIAAALWFASRGTGKIDGTIEYTSLARVILSGLGSDEQLAGYGRHRTQFQKKSWSGLNNELDMDMRRLWARNLDRDDRIISSHGKEVRMPFLDEDFIAFIRQTPLWHLTNMFLEPGVGDKMILRKATASLGLTQSSAFVKRAIQFGSNIAKLTKSGNKKQRGTDIISISIEDDD